MAVRPIHRGIIILLSIVGAVQVIVTCTPVLGPWFSYLIGPSWDEPRGEVLIILGAEETNPGEIMGIGTYWRCVTAILAWRAHTYKRVVVSGGGGVAANMAAFLTFHGVPSAVIEIEPDSQSTWENAQFTARLLRQSSYHDLDLVTSDYHMRRAAAAFRKVGLNPRHVPAPDLGKRKTRLLERWSVFLALSRESMKLGWYFVRGYI